MGRGGKETSAFQKVESLCATEGFCILPFIHTATLTNGGVPLCCIARNDSGMNLNENSINESWNSDYIKSVRSKMLKGQRIRACQKCYEEEANNYSGHRIMENKRWRRVFGDENFLDILSKVDESGKTSGDIVSIDLRLGNTCNLQCVMCAPGESSTWKSAANNLISELKEERLIHEWAYKSNIRNERFEWYKKPEFWDQLQTHLPTLREVIIGGGEPMLIKRHLDFIKDCAESGHAKHIHLRYHTNATILPEEMIPYWEKFQVVEFFTSIDGHSQVNDYVRYPAKWDPIVKNLHLIDSLKDNLHLRFLYTVHALNVLHLPDFLRWVKAQKFKKETMPGNGDMQSFVHPGIVHAPDYLNIKTLPKHYKEIVTQQWNRVRREFADEDFDKYEAIITFMNSSDGSYRLPLLKDYIRALDKSRQTSIREVIPELAKELNFFEFDLKNHSKTFCVYPWIHQTTTPTGRIRFCCIAKDVDICHKDGTPMVLNKETFRDAWNSNAIKDVRRKMVEGKPVKGCEVCYEQEAVGKRSYRQRHNQEWISKLSAQYIEKIVKYSIDNDFSVNEMPSYLDLRLGNLCNLKCRMCNPYNSVQIYNEWLALDKKTGKKYSEFWSKHGMALSKCDDWYESELFWNSVEEHIPHLKKVYMTGGEPTLIKGNYRFLEKCREMGKASEIELFFNLNFTNLKDEFIEAVNDFRYTSINASFDGFEHVNDYIRSPGRWSHLKKNFEKLLEMGGDKIGIGISPVIQAYNVLDIVPLLNFSEDMMVKHDKIIMVDFLTCFHPSFLDLIMLPKNIKTEAINRLEEFKKHSRFYHQNNPRLLFMKNGIDSMIRRLTACLDEENPQLIHDFFDYTKTLDRQRNQNFPKTFPHLANLFKDSGYDYETAKATYC